MAVPVVAASGASATANGVPVNQKTFSITCSGTNRGLVVFVGIDYETANEPTVLSATFNGDALTFLGGIGVSLHRRGEWWGMVNPDAVTGDLVVTLSGSLSQEFAVGYAALTGVASTSAFSAVTTGSGLSDGTTDLTLAIACDNADDLVFGGVCVGTALPSNTGSMQNRFALAANNGVPTQAACAHSDTLVGEADLSVLFTWTFTAASNYCLVGVAVHPFVGVGVADRVGQVPI